MGHVTINIYGCGGEGTPTVGGALPRRLAGVRVEQGVPTFRRVRVANRARQNGLNQVPKRLKNIAYQPRRYNGVDGSGNPVYVDGKVIGSPSGMATPPYPDLADLKDKEAQLSDHATYAGPNTADTNPTRVKVWLAVQAANGTGPITPLPPFEIVMPDEVDAPNPQIGKWIASLSIDFASYDNSGALYNEVEFDMVFGNVGESLGLMHSMRV